MSHEEEKFTPQPEEECPLPSEDTGEPEKPRYVPRPKWQLVLAWVLLAAMVVAVAGYYFWIAYRYV